MKHAGRQTRLTIFVGESDRHGHTPLATEIVQIRGVEGFGASHHVHTTRILSLSDDLPMLIVIVDATDRITAFLPQLDDIISQGLVVLDEVDVVTYTP